MEPYQIAGAALEEALLGVLPGAGYLPLGSVANDPTIDPAKPRFTLRGRGTTHQIDSVADPVYSLPFSNPPRLLIEAKAYNEARRVGLSVVRNALGTLRDLTEFWRTETDGADRIPRYHYRYAIFATSEFTSGAQEFAYAQDIYLLPLRRSSFFREVVHAIDLLRQRFEETGTQEVESADYRGALRRAISEEWEPPEHAAELVAAVLRIGRAVIAVAERRFPLFLVPRSPEVLRTITDRVRIRIFRGETGWEIRREDGDVLFSFDLPEDLARMYAPGGNPDQDQALEMKSRSLRTIEAVVDDGELATRLVTLELDIPWLEAIRFRRAGGAR